MRQGSACSATLGGWLLTTREASDALGRACGRARATQATPIRSPRQASWEAGTFTRQAARRPRRAARPLVRSRVRRAHLRALRGHGGDGDVGVDPRDQAVTVVTATARGRRDRDLKVESRRRAGRAERTVRYALRASQ
jgi:hypothetical protein